MLTLFSYPALFGVADNNPYGLKVFAFLKLCGLDFRHEHIIDASAAPRGQLPYILNDGRQVGDSDGIIAYLTRRHALTLDRGMTRREQALDLLVRRTLDDLYWVISYSRWKDPRFWPPFRDAMLRAYPGLTTATMEAAREYNFQRYHFQGIGRFEPEDAYARGIADLDALAELLRESGYLFGTTPRSVDAGLYGFLANIHFCPINTPLVAHLATRPNLVAHCRSMHARIGGG
jgi:glutathione S-transferase